MTHRELGNEKVLIRPSRRTVIKALGAGGIVSVAAAGEVVGQADDKYELSRCISKDDAGNVVEVEGAGFFDSSTGRASGGGPFEFRNADGNVQAAGRWAAEKTKHWDEFGRIANGAVGGHLELGINFDPLVGDVVISGTLVIYCMIGCESQTSCVRHDHPNAYEGIKLDNYDERVTGATLFSDVD